MAGSYRGKSKGRFWPTGDLRHLSETAVQEAGISKSGHWLSDALDCTKLTRTRRNLLGWARSSEIFDHRTHGCGLADSRQRIVFEFLQEAFAAEFGLKDHPVTGRGDCPDTCGIRAFR